MFQLNTPITPDVPLPAARPVEGRDFLFATLDAGGHPSPALSVARDLLARGHRVRMLGDPTLEREIRAGGVEFVPWTRAPHRSPADPPKIATSANPLREFARVRDELICGPADRFAADTRAEIARRRPDCVVADLMLPGVAIGAEADAIPCASLAMTLISAPGWGVPPAGPGFAPAAGPLGRLRDGILWGLADRLWAKGVPALNRARAVNGLDDVGTAWEQVTRPERVLILSSAALEFAGFDPPDNVALIGPRLDDPVWAGDWAVPPGDAPLVLVALSSDQMGQAPVLRRIAAGFAGLDARAILTTGPCVDPAEVPAPPNVHVVRAAPHAAVLRQAAAVVTHAGHGTVAKAMAHGVPAVCVPLGRDQHDIAVRLAHIGAGVTVRAKSRPAAFAAAVRRVIAEPRYAEGARRAAATIERERRANRVVGELEALVRVGMPGAALAA